MIDRRQTMTAVPLMSSRSATYRLRAERMTSGPEVVTQQVAAQLLQLEWPPVYGPLTERADRVRRVFSEVVDHEEF
jgi:hypothetical protein